MLAQIKTVAFEGMNVVPVDVQVQITGGNSAMPIVGLPDKTVGESRERVRAALAALGLINRWTIAVALVFVANTIVLLKL